ncbi:MAG: 3'(2'),5'-bisphosphate nucleotidase CysQ [Gammaproteobacteria bacterium]|nr:3'(2'),5'-bisphosphate nucleotidase CysQ [Gammaproteobacteria bacterium]
MPEGDKGRMKIDDALLEAVRRLALEAGEAIMRIYAGKFDIVAKSDHTPVTAADLAAHRLIEAGLRKLAPQLPMLSEEGADIPYATRLQWSQYWLVDPLDGTREFIKRNGEFTVNIALIDGQEAVLGVVHAPALGVTYGARRGGGAWKWTDSQPLRIQAHPQATIPPRVATSRSHENERIRAYLKALGAHTRLPMGSALKSCLVAEGTADLYPRLGPTFEWDTAAAQCIVEEAGGFMTDTAMHRLCYNSKESLRNPEFFVFGDAKIDWSAFLPST